MLNQRSDERPQETPGAAIEEEIVADKTLRSKSGGSAATFSRNAAISVGRLFVSTLAALVLPAYLSHKLPVKTYSAWVLILQMSAYVGYLDFGVQTGIAKYVAEYDARKDAFGANLRASAGLAMMVGASILGVLLTLVLAWRVPYIFREMPSSLYRDVRVSLTLVGLSLSFGLICAVPSAIFLGLQRYGVPTVLSLVNRLLYTAVILAAVAHHSSLSAMGALVALINILIGFLQVVAWKKLAGHIRLSIFNLDRAVLRQMLSYCSVLTIWLAGMLCVSGLDLTIVGRYDYGQTAFYSIATLPTNFLISIMGAALGPLLPTASAFSAQRDPLAMGSVLLRMTRYSALLLALSGLPMLVAGYPILHLWVGAGYALQTVAYLRVLVLANMIRNLCLPYSMMVVATERQKIGIAASMAEATVNIAASIYFARRFGAVGVALGTLLGSVVSVGMHFAFSMHFTFKSFRITRTRLALEGILRPGLMVLPSALCATHWWVVGPPTIGPGGWVAWGSSTLLLGWFAGLYADERRRLLGLVQGISKRAWTPIFGTPAPLAAPKKP